MTKHALPLAWPDASENGRAHMLRHPNVSGETSGCVCDERRGLARVETQAVERERS
jgi:hypothetical protein